MRRTRRYKKKYFTKRKQRRRNIHSNATTNNIVSRQYGGAIDPSIDNTLCKYISTRGIMQSCDIHSSTPVSSIKTVDGYDFSKFTDGCTIFIAGSAIPAFLPIMKTLPGKFILVSGDCDENIPDEIFSSHDDFLKFIESDKIIHWFSCNCVKTHAKLTIIPIGVNYHSASFNDHRLYGKKSSPLEQEKNLIEIINNSKLLKDREVKCYANFQFMMTEDRADAIKRIPKELVFYETQQINRNETWKEQSKYAFVISPEGNGIDCHRTWEALFLGCIPIVKTSQIITLFEDLPILIVNNWSDITEELLNSTLLDFSTKKFNTDKLTLKYWLDIINSKKQ